MGIDFSKYKPVIKGKCIYIYTARYSKACYGYDLYMKIIEKYKDIEFIFAESTKHKHNLDNPQNIKHYSQDELIKDIYPRCFLGLRLTSHDGLSATVQELGLMGIKCIHNGESPSSINYNNFDDICRIIENEQQLIGTIDYDIADKVQKYLTIDPIIFNMDYYTT
jgi:hypothetical protein